MQEKVLVLESTAGNLLTGRRVTQLAANTELHHLKFQYMGEREVSADYVHYTFVDPEQGAEVVLVDDYLNDLAYLSFQNVPEPALSAMQRWLSEQIGIVHLHDVKAALQENLEANAPLLTHLGLMADRDVPDTDTAAIVQAALTSPVAETVERALVAAQLLGWPDFKEGVREVALHSSEPHLREFADKALVQLTATLVRN